MPESNDVGRRDFINVVLASLGTIITGVISLPAIGYLVSPATRVKKSEAWISAGPLDDYPIGSPTLFSFNRSTTNGWEKTVNTFGAYVFRLNADQVVVFSNLCTHLACRVNWKTDLNQYVCPCHDGRFDAAGNVAGGPPPAPLHTYETKLEEGSLYIHLTEG
jgi:menaquinol-cytochrome c reductase iron-sulfur subunit